MAEGVGDLARAGPPPAPHDAPGAGPAQRRAKIDRGRSEQRRRTDDHLARDRARQVHAEERQRRVGHRVDLAAHEVARRASRRYEPRNGTIRTSGRAPDASASRSDHAPAQATARRAGTREPSASDGLDLVVALDQRAHPGAAAELAAVGLDVARRRRAATAPKSTIPVFGECSADRPRAAGSIAGISSGPSRCSPCTPLARARRSSSSSRGRSSRPHGDDELAAALGASIPWSAQYSYSRGRALHAQPRLQRAGRVVDAGVDDAAVVRGLVLAQRALALEHDHAQPAQRQRPRGREPHDPSAGDRDVVHQRFGLTVGAA